MNIGLTTILIILLMIIIILSVWNIIASTKDHNIISEHMFDTKQLVRDVRDILKHDIPKLIKTKGSSSPNSPDDCDFVLFRVNITGNFNEIMTINGTLSGNHYPIIRTRYFDDLLDAKKYIKKLASDDDILLTNVFIEEVHANISKVKPYLNTYEESIKTYPEKE